MKVKVISLPYIIRVLYVLCFTRPRNQVSVYRTIGPLVKKVVSKKGHAFNAPDNHSNKEINVDVISNVMTFFDVAL